MAEEVLKKQHIEYIAVATLVVIALFVGMTRFRQKEKKSSDEVFSREEFNKKWQEVEILERNAPKQEEAVAYKVNGIIRSPFKSPFEEEAKEMVDESITLPKMSFQGMVWNSSMPQAIIENKVYDVGDTIKIGEEAMEIKDISKDGIYLKYKRKEFIVRPK